MTTTRVLAAELVEATVAFVKRKTDPLEARIAALEKRFETERKGLLYRGVWDASDSYEEGDFVTFGGSCWHCNAERTTAKPGTSPDWQLAVKAGRDGNRGRRG